MYIYVYVYIYIYMCKIYVKYVLRAAGTTEDLGSFKSTNFDELSSSRSKAEGYTGNTSRYAPRGEADFELCLNMCPGETHSCICHRWGPHEIL